MSRHNTTHVSQQQAENFGDRVALAMLLHKPRLTVTALALRIDRRRDVVSKAIHGHRFPLVRSQIVQALGISPE